MEFKYCITLIEPLLGTIAKSKEIFTRYIASERTGKEEIDTVPEGEESGYTGFHTKPDGIYLYNYQFKGFLKEAGNILKEELLIKSVKSKLDNYVFVFPREIWLAKEPDGINERSIRMMTMQGPRTSLAKSDYVNEGTSFEIIIRLLKHKEITKEVIEKLLDYGALKGLGQWRNASWGSFTWQAVAP